MNEMRKLMEAIERLNEANILSVENDEVEKHLDAAAKALAKDAVLQASGVWDEEGRDEGGYDTGAKSGKEYVSIAAPRFLDDEYKSSIMNSFENSFDNYVQHFLEYVNESVEITEGASAQEDKAKSDVSSIVDSFFKGTLKLSKGKSGMRGDLPSVLWLRFDVPRGNSEKFRQRILELRREGYKKSELADEIIQQITKAGYTTYNPFPTRNPVKIQTQYAGLGSDEPHLRVAIDFEGDSDYKYGSMDQVGNVQKSLRGSK